MNASPSIGKWYILLKRGRRLYIRTTIVKLKLSTDFCYPKCSIFSPPTPPYPPPSPLTTPPLPCPTFADRVARLRSWQQRIASGYVGSQKEEALQAEFLNLVFGQALGYEHERPDYRQLLLEKKTNVDGTKPDGALGDFAADGKGALTGPVRVVVELKDARTLTSMPSRSSGPKAAPKRPWSKLSPTHPRWGRAAAGW